MSIPLGIEWTNRSVADARSLYLVVLFCSSIDATNVTDRLGRFINDGIKGEVNAKARVVFVDNYPRLCIFALRQITSGREIRYDYGDPNTWWRKVNCER